MFAEFYIEQPKLFIQIIGMLSCDPWRRTMTFSQRTVALVAGYDIFRRDAVFIDIFAQRRLSAWLGAGWPLAGKILCN